jgi:thioredoxin-like negative regulator of GroEL
VRLTKKTGSVKFRPLELTDTSFDTEVLKSTLPVLIDFWAICCGPCRMVSPIVEEIAGDYTGKLKVGKVDVDSNAATEGFRDGKGWGATHRD